jgi:hypothetical protein
MSAERGVAPERRTRAVEPPGDRGDTPRLGLWVGGVTVVVTALLVHAGWTTGEWRGVVVSEFQVLVVAAVTYLGLRG